MASRVTIDNQFGTVEKVLQPSSTLEVNTIQSAPTALHFQEDKFSYGYHKIYENLNLNEYKGRWGKNCYPTKPGTELEKFIFQDNSFFKSSPSPFKKLPGEGDSRDNHSSNDTYKSLSINYPLKEDVTDNYNLKRVLSTVTKIKRIQNTSNGLSNEVQQNRMVIAPEKSEKHENEGSIKYEKHPSNKTEEYTNSQSNHHLSPREKGEFVSTLDEAFPKAYEPSHVEKDLYKIWEERGYFKEKTKKDERFSLVLPPPNVTGSLHLGHAITLAIQDALVRWYRMKGRDVVWIPGLDHAGIATQTVVEKWLKSKKQVSRYDIGQEQFLKEVDDWKTEKSATIKQQIKKLGASLDWSREIYTLDPRHNKVVVEAIVRLWNSGLVYRKESLVNWSCDLCSAISDIEVSRLEVNGPTPLNIPGYDKPVVFGELVEIKYKVCDSDEEVVVATTRPETMLGDVAIAVHPSDSRYRHLHGRKVWHPLRNVAIPIVADDTVDMNVGTGAVKITPGHSLVDWDLAERHKLPMLSVIDSKGRISTEECGSKFKGLKRFDARDLVKSELGKLGLLKGVRPHNMQIPICSRSGDVVEYLLKHQWFISCKTMAEKAATALRAGLLHIEPPGHNNTWFVFLDNIRDWCISRQLWWGHRIPMYHATAGERSTWVAAASRSEAMARAEALLGRQPDILTQDPDVLDTWFSSALYPLSALGWPKQTKDMKRYYPLDLMETGHDILFFWVARMVMLGVELTGELPFKKILLHGIVCDAMGRKMSKSLGNVISPEDVIYGKTLQDLKLSLESSHRAGLMSAKEKELAAKGQQKLFPKGIPACGTDALRFTLLSHKTKSHLISFDVRECEANHNFMNKIWQASRFCLYWAKLLGVGQIKEPQTPSLMDRWILSQLSRTVETVNANMASADFHQVTSAVKDFLYYTFCDYYVEVAKPVLREGSDAEAVSTCQTLLYCLDVSLRLASPFTPFISEQLYRHLPGHSDDSCMLASYPSRMEKWRDPDLDAKVQLGIEFLCAIRTLKSTNGFYRKNLPVEIETSKVDEITPFKSMIELLAQCSLEVTELSGKIRKQTITNTVGDHSFIHLNLKNISQEQFDEYHRSLTKKEAKIKKNIEKMVERFRKGGVKRTENETQLKMEEQIKTLEAELKSVQALMDVNKSA